MNTITLTMWTSAAILVFLMATDNNLYNWFILQLRWIPLQMKRYYLMMVLHPRNHLTTWYIQRRIRAVLNKYDA